MNFHIEKRHRLYSAQGFTLIEVLVCVAILATLIISMFAVYTHAIREIRRARNRTIATNAAQMMLEMIMSSPHEATAYNGLNTTAVPETTAVSIQKDLLHWKSSLESLPETAVGAISATPDQACVDITTETETQVLCVDLLLVKVDIDYNNHGRQSTQTLSVTLEKR